ncbi:MAG: discoidin domain-containing protein [Tannerellaceae bacterium]|jgi:beta-galactosidase/beta-glucuronidase|nr:discoidin domain-containing protein [Tannerellaceae bacterium]
MKKNKLLLFLLISILFVIGTDCSGLNKRGNIAFRRAVYQSSALNYNATGHLVTDGIFTVSKQKRHRFQSQFSGSPSGEGTDAAFDGKTKTKWLTFNNSTWLQIQFGDAKALKANYYKITSANDSPKRDPKDWVLEGSDDGAVFVELDKRGGVIFEKREEEKIYKISNPGEYKYYRLNILSNNGDTRTQLSEWDLTDENRESIIERFDEEKTFDSRWISASNKDEWLYVDLGAVSNLNEVILFWDKLNWASVYDIQLSDNTKDWETVYSKKTGKGGIESCVVNNKKARYVRLVCRSGTGERFSLVEMEVYGSNKLAYQLPLIPAPLADGTQYLRDGNWRLQRASEVETQDGAVISKPGFDDKTWLPAKVPGTVLRSYMLAGAIPDPGYSDQQVQISDSYFTANFWYRTEFTIPSSKKGETTWLNFDAINWKADVYFNGHHLGRIDGAFIRGRFDISKLVNYGKDNYIAVLIHKNDNPGSVTLQTLDSPGKNGGVLGADNPTIHASVGWDWVPTIRGRNIGIYNEVYLSYTHDVQIRDPWIVVSNLDVKDEKASQADLSVRTELHNPSAETREVVIKGIIQPGELTFESSPITLLPNETREINVNELTMPNPQLWWPATYGDQFLYTAKLSAYSNGEYTDCKEFKFGVREITYDTVKPFTVFCNGTRIVCRGGNWGMDDSNLANTEEDYDIKVRLHAEANLTMIRNWVGMTGHEAFYRACDKYGVLIWDDFWLANPGDGPNPNDEIMFMQNVRDKIKRNRHHAALAFYCGRNEGMPPQTLNVAFDETVKELDGTRHYIPHSAAGVVSGWGPYSIQDSEYYFRNTGNTLHSERGMPNVPALESMKKFLPAEHQWPIDEVWGIHDFTMNGAQGGGSFINKMRRYGHFNDLASFVRYAQLVNFEGHKSLFEAVYTNRANGMLMWMSQSAWPSMVWQTYDYYYDTNGGYFGLKKGNQPVNAIFNFATHDIVLVNATARERKYLKVLVHVFDVQGKLLKTITQTETISPDEQRIIAHLDLSGFSGVVFVKTHVFDNREIELADNFTWINAAEKYNYSAMSTIPEATLHISYEFEGESKAGENIYHMKVRNTGNSPALMIRIKTMNDKEKELVLPVYYQDNYFSLMPGESKTISITLDKKYLKGSKPSFYVEGWNKRTTKID